MIEALAALFPSVALAGAAGGVGTVAGLAAVPLAARRALAQPLPTAAADEAAVLAGVLADPSRYAYLTALTPEAFVIADHRALWALLGDAAGLPELGADAGDDACQAAAATVRARAGAVRDAVVAGAAAAGTTWYVEELCAVAADLDDEAVMVAAAAVLGAADERAGCPTEPTETPDSLDPALPPLRRVPVPVTGARRALVAGIGALAGALVPGLVLTFTATPAAAALCALSLVAALFACLVLALVDADTLYIDQPTWAVGTAVSWAAALGAAVVAGDPWKAGTGLLAVTAVAAFLEGLNFVYRKVRGRDGQGFGDTMLIAITVGVPAALTGSLVFGGVSLFAAAVAALVVWLVGAAAGRLDRESQFPFGPWLGVGMVASLVAFVLV